jgi:hypothetical protein
LVAVVNERFARAFFGTASALGRRITSAGVTYEIVGVVADAKYQDLRESTFRTMYVPWMQRHENRPPYSFVLRVARGDPLRMASSVERIFRESAPALRIGRLWPYGWWIDSGIPTERLMATVGGLIGALALILAGVGVFGVLAFQVERRTNELGVRTVLGASRWSMMRLVLRDVLMMLVPGVAIGTAVALMVTGLTRNLLFGLTPTEPAVFVGAASILAAAALAAGWIPARRASSIDPLVALRHE